MIEVNKDIILEKAKDENWTCKVNINEKWKYMYSKYSPIKKINNVYKEPNYLFLGIGLGYELNNLIENTCGKIVVIDRDMTFYNLASKLGLLDKVIDNERVTFLFGDEYKIYSFDNIKKYQLINNENITEYKFNFFFEVIKHFSKKNVDRKNEKIAFYQHVTIADDCIEALRNLGYEVVKMNFSTRDKMIQDIVNENPDFIFSINLSEKISSVSEILSIPYISWTVDTPAYSLYDNLLENKNTFAFIYDNDIVKELNQRNFSNVYYSPVAANVKRLDKIKVSLDDVKKYSCDVSFLGSTDIDNEFNKNVFKTFSDNTYKKINNIFSRWLIDENNFSIDSIDNDLVKSIEKESRYNINPQVYMDKKEKLAFLLGRKFNETQRIEMVRKLASNFNLHVYGDEAWCNLDIGDIKYKGYADHFTEMPKVFNCSKVNVNYTRIYVSSGLPMRVFDVVGSKGFLVTNYKEDIKKYFIDGKDLIVYRDIKDLIEITKYYLNHEKERQEIIFNGYEKVKSEHNFEKRLKEIMKIVKKQLNLG